MIFRHLKRIAGTLALAAVVWAWGAPAVAQTGVPTPEAEPASPLPTPHIHLISGSGEYDSHGSLRAWKAWMEQRYAVRITATWAEDRATTLTGLDDLAESDLLLVYCRRLELDGPTLRPIREFVASGRPVLGLRTASHAFQTWLAFDKEILGGDYQGHGPVEPVRITVRNGGFSHPVLKDVAPWAHTGKLYRNPAVAEDIVPLLYGQGADGREPVAWVRERAGGQRVFYTSLGVSEDFQDPNFLRLLENACQWLTGRQWEKKAAPGE